MWRNKQTTYIHNITIETIMSSFDRSSGNIPRNNFIITLTRMLEKLEICIFNERSSVVNVFPSINGIIKTLNEEAQNDLTVLSQKISDWRKSKKPYTREDVEDAYGELVAYLHTGYLKEVNYSAAPKYAKKGHLKAPT